MQKLALVLFFFATLVFAQFFPNWPETSEPPIGAHVVTGIILLIVIALLIRMIATSEIMINTKISPF